MTTRADGLSSMEKDALVQALVAKFREEPDTVQSILPEAAEILQRVAPRRGSSEHPLPTLTEREKEERLRSLQAKVALMNRNRKAFSPEAAVEALEDAAALAEASITGLSAMKREDLIRLVQIATGFPFSKKGKPAQWIRREGEPARAVNLLRGVRLYLTWDKKLIRVEVEPRKLAQAEKAMKFVGMGQDTAGDVAERHDEYLAGAIV
ncbi:MAG: hypothetical protein HYX92_13575 [Chloroflexi bacterium]|nr:hypothetical protein [Chloroflexota bacterium]